METILFWGATKGKGNGIGTALATALASTQSKVILAGRNREKLEQLGGELNSPIFVSDYPIDFNKYEKVLFAHDISTVISFIGTGYAESLPFIEDASINEMLQSNFLVNLDIIRKSISFLKGKHRNIIVINSIAGIIPQEGASVYTATKFALRGLMESLRYEIKPYQIGLSSLYFQNVNHIGIQPILDCVLTSIKNKTINFDFIIN